MTKEKPVCSHCGSEDVYLDAYADWNPVTQRFDEVRATFDQSYCEDCGGETSIKMVEVTA